MPLLTVRRRCQQTDSTYNKQINNSHTAKKMLSSDVPNLRPLRLAAGLSREHLANLTGISWRTIHRWEQGANSPTVRDTKLLATVLGVSLAQILGLPEPSSEPPSEDPNGFKDRLIQLLLTELGQVGPQKPL